MAPRRPRAPRRRGAAKPRRAMVGRKSKPMPRKRTAKRSAGPKRQLIQANLGGLSMTRFGLSRSVTPQLSAIKKVGQPNFTNIQYSWNFGSSAGKQGISEAFLNHRNDLMRIWASIQNQTIGINPVTLVRYPQDDATKRVTNASWRLALESASQTLHFANTGSTPVNVELYDVVCSKHVPLTALDLSGNLEQAGGYNLVMTPIVAWQNGYLNEFRDSTGFKDAYTLNSNIDNLGAVPTSSELFRRYYKIVRRTALSLPIGGQHKHVVDLKSNYIINNNLFSQNGLFQGLSYTTLMVVSGVPVVGCPGEGQFAAPVLTSQTSVSCVQAVKYKWTWTADQQVNTYNANYMPQSSVGAQSIQPAFTKVYDADSSFAKIPAGNGGGATTYLYTDLPSECTR